MELVSTQSAVQVSLARKGWNVVWCFCCCLSPTLRIVRTTKRRTKRCWSCAETWAEPSQSWKWSKGGRRVRESCCTSLWRSLRRGWCASAASTDQTCSDSLRRTSVVRFLRNVMSDFGGEVMAEVLAEQALVRPQIIPLVPLTNQYRHQDHMDHKDYKSKVRSLTQA